MDEYEIAEQLHYLRTAPRSTLESRLIELQQRDPDFDPWANPYVDTSPQQIQRKNLPMLRRVMGNDVIDRLLARPNVEVI